MQNSKQTNCSTTIVVLTYNRAPVLRRLLLSLETLNHGQVEVIVVDNCSEDDTETMMKNTFPQYKYIRTKENIGVAARNLGMQEASGEFVICLDDDVYGIDERAIEKLHQKFGQCDEIGAINFGIIDHYTGDVCNWPYRCSPNENFHKTFSTCAITEGAVSFRKKALLDAGFYPSYFFISHEGIDLALRIMNAGYKVIYDGEIVVTHCHSELGRKKWTNYYYDTRNHLWLAFRNFPVYYLIKYLARNLLVTLVYAIRDGYLRYWFKAIKDGVTNIPEIMNDRKVLGHRTMCEISLIDKNKASFFSRVRQRLFRRNIRL